MLNSCSTFFTLLQTAISFKLTVLSSAVQCSLSDGGPLRVSQQQPEVLRKLEIPPNKKMEYAEEELDTGSICSDDYSSDEEWLVFFL